MQIHDLQEQIRQQEIICKRKPSSVLLLAVSKGRSINQIQQARTAGICDFGESYLQEALPKITALENSGLTWHFIGPVQSNKAKLIARYFSWVHSVDCIKTATLLNNARSQTDPRLNICVQINFENEATKSGISPDIAAELISQIVQLPNLHLRGLMMIPKPQNIPIFDQLTKLLQSLNTSLNLSMDTLSMGMSQDFNEAICAGSTIVRLGRILFDNLETIRDTSKEV